MLINSIAFGLLLACLAGAYAYFILSEKKFERRNEALQAEWEQDEADSLAREELKLQRKERVPLAERLRELSFDHVQRFGVRQAEILLDHPRD